MFEGGVGGEIYTPWKAKWQKQLKTGASPGRKCAKLKKTLEILMKTFLGCLPTGAG
jgi:hypothetical protein